MKIISWNLLHRSGATLDDVERLIAEERPALLLMQEVTGAVDALPSRIGGHYARNTLPGRHHGLATWSESPFLQPPTALTLPSGLIVRRVCQIVELPTLVVANVHLSHGQMLNRRQLKRIFDILPSHAAVLGDCNMIGPLLRSGFRDVGPRRPTHIAGSVVPLRLDRCFVRGLSCTESRVLARGGSDHRPIVVRLRPSPK